MIQNTSPGTCMVLVLGDIPVIRYYRDKYIHDNIIVSILAHCDNRANDITAITANTTCTKPLSTVSSSRYKLETSCLQCSTTGILFTSKVQTMVCWETSGYSHATVLCIIWVCINLFSTYDYRDNHGVIMMITVMTFFLIIAQHYTIWQPHCAVRVKARADIACAPCTMYMYHAICMHDIIAAFISTKFMICKQWCLLKG